MPLISNSYRFFSKYLSEYPLGHLQIGVFDGYCFAELARQFPAKPFYAIDPFIEDGHTSHLTNRKQGDAIPVQEAEFMRNTADLSNVKLFRQKSLDFRSEPGMEIDSILIDGSHHYVDVARDIQIMMELFRGKSHCVAYFDDYDNRVHGVVKAVNELLRNAKRHTVGRYEPLDGSSLILKLDFST